MWSLAEKWQCPYSFLFAGKSSPVSWLWGAVGDNSGDYAFLARFLDTETTSRLSLDPSLSHTPRVIGWQNRLEGGKRVAERSVRRPEQWSR